MIHFTAWLFSTIYFNCMRDFNNQTSESYVICYAAQLPAAPTRPVSTEECVKLPYLLFLYVLIPWSVCYREEDTSVDNAAAGKNLLNDWFISYQRNNRNKG